MSIGKRAKPSKKAAAPGFTFIELLVVMTLAALMAVAAIPAWRQYNQVATLRSSVQSMATLFRFAHITAVEEGVERQITLDAESGTYRLEPLPDEDGNTARAGTEWEKTRFLPTGVTMEISSQELEGEAASQDVFFYPDGTNSSLSVELNSAVGSYLVDVSPVTSGVRVRRSSAEGDG